MREFDMQEVMDETARIKDVEQTEEKIAAEYARAKQRLFDQCVTAVNCLYPELGYAHRAVKADVVYKSIIQKDTTYRTKGE